MFSGLFLLVVLHVLLWSSFPLLFPHLSQPQCWHRSLPTGSLVISTHQCLHWDGLYGSILHLSAPSTLPAPSQHLFPYDCCSWPTFLYLDLISHFLHDFPFLKGVSIRSWRFLHYFVQWQCLTARACSYLSVNYFIVLLA